MDNVLKRKGKPVVGSGEPEQLIRYRRIFPDNRFPFAETSRINALFFTITQVPVFFKSITWMKRGRMA